MSVGGRWDRVIEGVDRRQRSIPLIGFPLAVMRKYSDDRGGQLAALMSYYGFFALFPLLFVFVTVLGIVLETDAAMQDDLVDSALSTFPVIGEQVNASVRMPATGSWTAVAVATLVALYAGLAATDIAQEALNTVFGIPLLERRSFFVRKARGLVTLIVFGVAIVASTVLGSMVARAGLGGFAAGVLSYAGTVVVNAGLVAALLAVVPHERPGWIEIRAGALVGGVLWATLQLVGVVYVGRVVSHASATYGVFAVVIGLLSWIYLLGATLLMSAEVTATMGAGFWPRALVRNRPTPADLAAAEAVTARETLIPRSIEPPGGSVRGRDDA